MILRRTFQLSARVLKNSLPDLDAASNYFQLFALSKPSYRVSVPDLRRTFLDWQRRVHPDSFAQSDAATITKARAASELINKAYRTLCSDLERAEYMLGLNGIQIGEDESVTDPGLLSHIMETREQLEEATEQSAVDQVRQQNADLTNETTSSLADAFTKANYDDAKTLTVKLRYLTNVEGVCREWQPGKRVELQH